VVVATLVLVVVAALSDPLIMATVERVLDVAWRSALALLAQR